MRLKVDQKIEEQTVRAGMRPGNEEDWAQWQNEVPAPTPTHTPAPDVDPNREGLGDLRITFAPRS